MTQSKQYPEIQKLQNHTLVPYNIQQKQQTDEDGVTTDYYNYDLIKESLGFSATLESIKDVVLNKLKSDNSKYIQSKYDLGSQQTLQAIYTDSNALVATKTTIESVWEYIKNILAYYYTKKTAIKNANTITDIIAVTWNFTKFDTSNPNIELENTL